MKKRIFSILLAMVMILGVSSYSYADTNKKDELKFSENLVNINKAKISDAMRKELLKSKGEIVSITETEYSVGTNGKLHKIDKNNQTRTISTSDFKMTVVAQRIEDEDDYFYEEGCDNFKFVATGEWLTNPFFEFTDCIALNWSDNFTLKTHYAYVNRSSNSSDSTVTAVNKIVPEAGVAYDVDLKLFAEDEEVVLAAYVFKDDDTGSANVVGEYGHVLIKPAEVSVGFTAGESPSIDMSVSWHADIDMASPGYAYFRY